MDIQNIKETLQLNSEEIKGNRDLTNELVIDDIMLSLGYNKKRVKGVRRLYDDSIDWEVIIDEQKRFIIKTVGYKNSIELNQEEIFDTYSGYDFLLLTDGDKLNLYSEKLSKCEPIFETSITEDSENYVDILSNIEKDKYAPKVLEDRYIAELLTIDELNKVIDDNIEDIIMTIIGLTGYKETKRNIQLVRDRVYRVSDDTTSIINENNEKVAELNNSIHKLEEENAKLKEEKANLEEENVRIQEEKANLEKEKTSLAEEKDNEETDNSLSNRIKELEEINSRLQEDKENLEIKIKEANSHKDELENERETLIEEKKSLEEKLREYVESAKDNNEAVVDVSKFTEEIERLNNEKAELKLQVKKFEGEIYRLKHSGEIADAEMETNAKQLLDTIEDNLDLDRAYVAVIGHKLFQTNSIHKFIGTAIEELYEEVGFKLLPVLFDGDSFMLVQNPEKPDFTINKKSYGIDFEDLSEQEILAKIIKLFQGFKEVKFVCKTIGTLREDSKGEEEITLEVPINSLNSVIWDDNTEIKRIEYIGNDTGIKCVIPQYNSDNLSMELSKVLEGLIGLSDDLIGAVKTIKSVDLAKVSKFIEVINKDNRKNPKIPFTRFTLSEIDNIGKCIPIINEICSIAKIDKDKIKLYIKAISTNTSIIDKYRVQTELDNVYQGEIKGNGELKEIEINGNIIDYLTFTKKSLKVQSDIIKKLKSVNIGDEQFEVVDNNNIAEIIKHCIENRVNKEVDFRCDLVGKVFGEEYNVLSTDIADVAVDNTEIEIDGTVYYISDMEEWQYVYSLIKVYALATKSRDIRFTVDIDSGAYEIYSNNTIDFDVSFILSVRTLIEYLRLKIEE